jgi:hypothetical protein
MDRPARHMISNDTGQINNRIVPMHVININRSLLPATDSAFFPSACGQPPTQATFLDIIHTCTDLKD